MEPYLKTKGIDDTSAVHGLLHMSLPPKVISEKRGNRFCPDPPKGSDVVANR